MWYSISQETAITPQRQTGKRMNKNTQKIDIILADDNDIFRELILTALSSDDRHITSCQDGKEALEWLEKKPFDLLITDLKMPEVEGIELLKAARKLHPEMLVIIVTGFGSLESAIEAIRLGAYDYLQKPFKIEEIQLVVNNACERIKLKRQNRLLWDQLVAAYEELARLKNEELYRQAVQKGSESKTIAANGSPMGHSFYFADPPLNLYEKDLPSRSQLLTQLERLATLKKEGLLSDSEFETCKETVMSLLDKL